MTTYSCARPTYKSMSSWALEKGSGWANGLCSCRCHTAVPNDVVDVFFVYFAIFAVAHVDRHWVGAHRVRNGRSEKRDWATIFLPLFLKTFRLP